MNSGAWIIFLGVYFGCFEKSMADIQFQLYYSNLAKKLDPSQFRYSAPEQLLNHLSGSSLKTFRNQVSTPLKLAAIPEPINVGRIDPAITSYIDDHFKFTADLIIDYLTKGEGKGDAFKQLAFLTDEYGNRLVGSSNYNRAADYVVDSMRKDGFDNVHTEQVEVPKWTRGDETARLISPRNHEIMILGLGGTVPTANRGITADAVVVSSLEELDQLGRQVIKGKIVIFNQVFLSYHYSAGFRKTGAPAAANYGAVAVLIKSATSHSTATLATGQMSYDDRYPKIPAAAITQEDAEMLQRMFQRNDRLRIFLRITSKPEGTTTSSNVVAQITGWEFPDQVVLISGHLDSWDVGTGAEDDGGGIMICWEALRVLRKLGLRPRRTVRAVFWTAEEEGLIGSKTYYAMHNNYKNYGNEKIVFVAESDEGAWAPIGLSFNGTEHGQRTMQAILNLMAPINATRLYQIRDAEDIDPWLYDGVPGVWMQNFYRDDYYFRFHHTRADTMTVFQPEDLDRAAALWTVVAFVVAELDPYLAFQLHI